MIFGLVLAEVLMDVLSWVRVGTMLCAPRLLSSRLRLDDLVLGG